VIDVLAELGVAPGDERIIEVWNKIDLLEGEQKTALARRAEQSKAPTVALSAVTGQGTDRLLALIESRLMETRSVFRLSLQPEQAHHMAWLFEHAEVLERSDDQTTGVVRMTVRIPEKRLTAFRTWAKKANLVPEVV